MTETMRTRLLFFHKQSTSGRTRFLRFRHGVCGFAPLPDGSRLREAGDDPPPVVVHPAAALREAARRLGLPEDRLRAEAEFDAWAETPEGELQVLLVAFATIDPPFVEAEAVGARFIPLTEARGLPRVEMELLRRAYEHVPG